MIAAIILAAGSSTRMGTLKANLEFRGTTFLGAILDATLGVGLSPRVVVLGHDADNILRSHDLAGVTVVSSEQLEAGPIGSIRAGIRAVLNHPVEAAIVWHVDRPHVKLETVMALVDRFRASGAQVVLPVYQGRRGHPVLFGKAVFSELLAAPVEQGARTVVRRDPARVAEVEVDDPAVLEDIDTPAAYQALLRRVDASRE